MKKIVLILAMGVITHMANAQLLITSSVPTDKGVYDSVTVNFSEFYLNQALNSQFSVYTMIDSVKCEAFVDGGIIGKSYIFQLDSIPNINVMWDSVKTRLEQKGLTVEIAQ